MLFPSNVATLLSFCRLSSGTKKRAGGRGENRARSFWNEVSTDGGRRSFLSDQVNTWRKRRGCVAVDWVTSVQTQTNKQTNIISEPYICGETWEEGRANIIGEANINNRPFADI